LVETAAYDGVDVLLERQLSVESDAEVSDGVRSGHWNAVDDRLDTADLLQLSTCSEPDELRLVGVKFQPVGAHLPVDVVDTAQKLSGRRCTINS